MTTRGVASVLSLLVVVSVSYFACPVALSQSEARLNLDGFVFVVPIDSRRIIVAVDADSDGVSDHLFLYAASEKLRVTPRLASVHATIQYHSGQRLLLTLAGSPRILEFLANGAVRSGSEEDSAIRFEKTAGLSHYVPTSPLKVKDLETLRKVADCNTQPQSCLEVAGQFLPFPA